MKNILLMAAIACLAFSCNKKSKSDPTHTEKVQTAVDGVRKDLSEALGMDYPSISVLIQTPAEKIFVSSSAAGAPAVTADTRFRFASNTKNFTGAAILKMHQDGWLDYEAKITDTIPSTSQTYVPATPEWAFPYYDQITIKQLLQHAAGVFDIDNDAVPGYGGQTYTEYILNTDPGHQFSTDEMVGVLTSKNLSYFAPGTGYHYSNTGYSILAKIISRVYSSKSGTVKTYSDYMKDFIVGPNAPVPLSSVNFPILASDITLPDPHIKGTVLEPSGTTIYDEANMSAQPGEGNGYGTMNDLNTYIRTLMKGENVLTPATVALMQHDVSTANAEYGLGCTHRPNLGYGHNGARIGYLSTMLYDPATDVSVVVLLPLWDLRNGNESFLHCFNALTDAGYAARAALGFPGKP